MLALFWFMRAPPAFDRGLSNAATSSSVTRLLWLAPTAITHESLPSCRSPLLQHLPPSRLARWTVDCGRAPYETTSQSLYQGRLPFYSPTSQGWPSMNASCSFLCGVFGLQSPWTCPSSWTTSYFCCLFLLPMTRVAGSIFAITQVDYCFFLSRLSGL